MAEEAAFVSVRPSRLAAAVVSAGPRLLSGSTSASSSEVAASSSALQDAELSAWRGAAITAAVALALVLVAGLVVYVWHQRRQAAIQTSRREDASDHALRKVAWGGDIEHGECNLEYLEGRKLGHAPSDTDQLYASLRELLEEEISRGLHAAGVSDRLERLERKEEICESLERWSAKSSLSGLNGRMHRLERHVDQVLSGALLPSGGGSEVGVLPLSAKPSRPLQASSLSAPAPPAVLSLPSATRDVGTSMVSFGPTLRQLELIDPPEKDCPDFGEGIALQQSLQTVQRQLGRRDSQTQELTRQLRKCQQSLRLQTTDAKTAAKRLKDLMTDPSLAPRYQAEELHRLREDIAALSRRLSDTKHAEMYWSLVARWQRAFFMQNERLSPEGRHLVNTHPAGEIFLAPAPVLLDDDEEEDGRKAFDIATAVINPYVTDSWPFEPNVLAQRTFQQDPPMQGIEEEEEDYEDSDSDVEAGGALTWSTERARNSTAQHLHPPSKSRLPATLHLRLPPPVTDEDSELYSEEGEGSECVEEAHPAPPTHSPPTLGVNESSRSF
eukprot:TRINITY_DN80486_c0_g1_i1.p1 TRINITY_DN80486_c0_g1~~TRINITY_DN80486_c0_g1_i1.p1  ORF type:complete len:555 (+),score=130.45 TRINITY_DN80486_c0_g1_i1:78-1742(+)